MKTIILIIICLIGIIYVGSPTISLKPFSISFEKPYLPFAVIFFSLALIMNSLQFRNIGYKNGYGDAIKEIIKKKQPKLFFRVSNNKTEQGLWYDFEGNFTGLIHDNFKFCKNNSLQMPFDPEIIGWLSATETLSELFNWFTQEDITNLEKYGFTISIYEASDYRFYNNHWLIKQENSRFISHLNLNGRKYLGFA